MSRPKDPAAQAAAVVLRAGTAVSLLLIAGGLAAARLGGVPVPPDALPLGEALASALRGAPAGLLSLGLAALLATPALRVLVLAWQFARHREWAFAGVSAVVLAVLGLSVLAGRGH